jgi:hypothetical protein
VSYHLQGAAQTWYFTLGQDEDRPTWERFKELCHIQFGPPVRGSRLAELDRIQFHSTVQDYTDRFNTVLCHARNLDSSQKADLCVGGLPDHIWVNVELRAPRDLPTAVYLSSAPIPCWRNDLRSRHASAPHTSGTTAPSTAGAATSKRSPSRHTRAGRAAADPSVSSPHASGTDGAVSSRVMLQL